MSINNTNNQIQMFTEFAELARALGNTHRLILLEYIAQGERSVERLVELSQLSVANTSQHLQHLKRSGLVQSRREGKHILYRLGNGPVVNLLTALRQYAEYNRSEIRELVSNTVNQEAISREELLSRLKEASITLLDVRPEDEFAQGHLPGAINIPADELESRIAELTPNQEIVAYCRGPYCTLSVNAAAALRAKGWQVRRLDDGFPDWKAAGLTVETTK